MNNAEPKEQVTSPIYFGDVFSSEKIIRLCQHTFGHVVIITDDNVKPNYAEKLQQYLSCHQINSHTLTIPPGEKSKSREMKSYLEDELLALGCGRDTIILALGGGVITDLVGFVAATYCRGIPVIYIPTTVLAMVDAAIGGKTGVNTVHGKNLIGTFTQPQAIFIDIQFVNTLPEDEYSFAFAEIIKHALIYDESYFDYLVSHATSLKKRDFETLYYAIKRSCEIKTAIVHQDEKESGQREILNFGHTIAHALETVADYTISHGQAVGIGIVVESYIANQIGLLSDKDLQRIRLMISLFDIPFSINNMAKATFKQAMATDKKTRKNQQRFVMLEKIGKVFSADGYYARPIDDTILDQALEFLFKMYVE